MRGKVGGVSRGEKGMGAGRGGNSCQWVMFVSYQCMNRVNIRQPKPDTNNKRVNIR